MHLGVVDTAQIQPYVYGSNRLRENIGGSHRVAQATGEWALEAIRQVAGRSNVIEPKDLKLDDKQRLEASGDLSAEVLYAGGGNLVVLFRNTDLASKFTQKLSRQALEEAPGLQLVTCGRDFDGNTSLADAVDGLLKQLAREKRQRTPSSPLLGLGVTRKCASTELPAVGLTREFRGDPRTAYPASAEIHGKLAVVRPMSRAANERLRRVIPPPQGYEYPSEFDEMGRTHGEHSYLAVVHADGDGMGKRFQAVGDNYRRPEQNREYVQQLRDLSRGVNDAALKALRDTVLLLGTRLDESRRSQHPDTFSARQLASLPLQPAEEGGFYLPFRPVVFGGDDVTFVADGRLGLALALAYLRRFEEQTANLKGGPATSCAGIAIVKVHYPFARAYALAEDLCRSAKKLRSSIANFNGSCLDWHFALSGLGSDIEEIREREYTVEEGVLHLRPVTLRSNPMKSHHAWNVIARGVTEFRKPGWAGRRNKVKALRDALREGHSAVNQFLAHFNNNQPLPVVEESLQDWPRKGWQQGVCGYFDAIELADWFISLEGDTP